MLHSYYVKNKKDPQPEPPIFEQSEKITFFFKDYFSADKRTVDCFIILLLSILQCRTVNLEEPALPKAASPGVKSDSPVRRFQRFSGCSFLSADKVGAIVTALLKPDDVVISIDRTNWKSGKTHINLLIAGICFQNVCLPVAYVVLPASTKRGNSKALHRKKILNQVLQLLRAEQITAFVGDREFTGEDWISCLNKKGIPFIIRIRIIDSVDGITAKEAIRRRLLSKAKRKNRRFKVCGAEVYITVKTLKRKKQPDGTGKAEKLILISNVYATEKRMPGYYRQREAIEHLFSNWKKRGFNFESTRMKGEKLEQWIGLLTLCVSICMLWGEKQTEEKEIRVKGHGFRARSLFRYGLDNIREMLYNGAKRVEEWGHFLAFILKHLKNAYFPNSIYVG